MTAAPSPWMTAPEVAEYARIGRTEVMAALSDGSLRGYQNKAGGRWRVHIDDIDAWLRGETPPAVSPRFIRGRAS